MFGVTMRVGSYGEAEDKIIRNILLDVLFLIEGEIYCGTVWNSRQFTGSLGRSKNHWGLSNQDNRQMIKTQLLTGHNFPLLLGTPDFPAYRSPRPTVGTHKILAIPPLPSANKQVLYSASFFLQFVSYSKSCLETLDGRNLH